MRELSVLIAFASWMAGIALAKGFLSTGIAIFIPFWAYFLVIERLMVMYGLL